MVVLCEELDVPDYTLESEAIFQNENSLQMEASFSWLGDDIE